MLTTAPRVIGVDLAAATTGIALPDGTTTIIRAPKARGKTRVLADDMDRLNHITTAVETLLTDHTPDLVVIEDYAAGIKSAAAHRLAEVGGCVRLTCHRAQVPFALVNVKHLKIYAAGTGAAEKRHMAVAASKRADLEFDTDDECDAWWLRAMGLDRLGVPPLVMPQLNREVLDKVVWPELRDAS